MLEVDSLPTLTDPVLVVAIQGWVDAGTAGATAATVLRDRLGSARTFARFDLADLVDLQQTRPEVERSRGRPRISWPTLEVVAGRAGRDVVVVHGPEPSLRWGSVLRALVDLAQDLGVRDAYGLAAMPAAVTHRRPVPVHGAVTLGAPAPSSAALRDDYVGPTGLQTALLVALDEVGIPGTGLWAQVPHYVAGSPSPAAARALLEHLAASAGLVLDLDDLRREAEIYAQRVEDGLVERPDVAELVAAIEVEHPGDDLATEVEEFLRHLDDPEG